MHHGLGIIHPAQEQQTTQTHCDKIHHDAPMVKLKTDKNHQLV